MRSDPSATVKTTDSLLGIAIRMYRKVIWEGSLNLLDHILTYLTTEDHIMKYVNILFTYHVALSLALTWSFFLNFAINLWVGLFLHSNVSDLEFNILPDTCSLIVMFCTVQVLYSFEQHLFILTYGSWNDFPQVREHLLLKNVSLDY